MFLTPLPPNFEAALRDAEAKDPKFRLAAAKALASAAEQEEDRVPEAELALTRLADDAYGPVRAAALDSLGYLCTGLPVLLDHIADEHIEARQAAIAGAAGFDPNAVDWLSELAKDEAPDVRFEALHALANHAPSHALDAALAALEDENEDVRASATRILARVLTHRDPDGRADTIDAIAKRLDDDWNGVRRSAAVALAELNDARGEAILVEALEDKNWRLDATEALGHIASPAARDALAMRASSFFGSLLIRAAAGAALARRGDRRGVDALRRVLRAWRADGRDYAVHAAGELRLVDLVPDLAALTRRLRGADPHVLGEALHQLAEESADAAAALAQLPRLEPTE